MQRRDILYSALIATALALTPFTPTPISQSAKHQANSLSMSIASILHKRGLDDDAAREVSENYFADNEDLFSFMLKNLENGCSIISEDELMNYVSSMALQRKDVELDSYKSLVGMVHKMKNRALSKVELKELHNIATKNYLFSQQIA